MSNASEQFRMEAGNGDAIRDGGLTTPANIRRYDDIQYGIDPEWNILDVYRPRYSFGKKLPVILIVHGGGWVYGTKEVYQFYGMELAKRGFAVVNYTYRLAPENKFPACLEDSIRVLHWMEANADTYLFDLDKVFAVGDSAGGHMLGLLCALLYNPDYAIRFPFRAPDGFEIKGIGMNCGAYDVFNPELTANWSQNYELMTDLLHDADDEGERELVNVLRWVNEKFPPAYIMSCAGDFLLKQQPLLVKKYEEVGVRHVSKIYGDEEQPLYHVFHCNVREPMGQTCNDDECNFFKKIF